MHSGSRAALAAARRAVQQNQGQQARCTSLAATRGFCSGSAAAAPLRAIAIHQQDVSPVQQLISLRRHFSAAPASVPGAVPGTGGGAAEKQTGAGSGAAGIAEGSTGAATGPAAGGAEVSTGLGMPGQSEPAEAGIGLRDPTDTSQAEQQEGTASADDGAAAERTADPAQPPEGTSGAGAPPHADPQAAGSSEQQAEADTAAAGSSDGAAEPGGASGGGGGGGDNAEQTGPGDEPVKAEAEDESGILHWVIETIQDLSGQLSVRVMRRLVETEFNEKEFLESAKDAYYIVNDLFASRDFDTLAPMVSEKLLDAFRGTHEDYDRQGYSFRLAKQTVDDAAITEVITLPKETIARLDPPLAALAPDVDPTTAAGSGAVAAAAAVASQNATVETNWRARLNRTTSRIAASEPFLVVGVRFRGEQELETRAKEGGKLLSLLKDKRSHVWRFVRGPLPQTDLPRRRLDLPWKLLDVVT